MGKIVDIKSKAKKESRHPDEGDVSNKTIVRMGKIFDRCVNDLIKKCGLYAHTLTVRYHYDEQGDLCHSTDFTGTWVDPNKRDSEKSMDLTEAPDGEGE